METKKQKTKNKGGKKKKKKEKGRAEERKWKRIRGAIRMQGHKGSLRRRCRR
jgi:hypothetical protein